MGCGLYLRDDLNLRPRADYRLGLVMRSPFNTGVAGDGAVVRLVLSDEARQAGLRPGDRILAMNGRPLPRSERPVVTLWHRLGEPGAVALLVAGPDGRRAARRLTSSPDHADQGLGASGLGYRAWRLIEVADLLVFETLVPLLLGALLLLRRARDPLAPWAALAFALTSVAGGMAARATVLVDGLPPPLWQGLAVLLGASLVVTLAAFPDARLRPRWCWPGLALGLALTTVASLPGLSLDEGNVVQALSLVPPIAVVWAKYRRMAAGPGRQQIRWVLFGLALSVIAYFVGTSLHALVNATASPATYVRAALAMNLAYSLYGSLFLVAVTVGLLRYRLYDADATISRSVAYGTMTLTLVAVFAGTEKAFELAGEHYLGDRLGALANALGAAAAAAMIGPLHHRVTRWTERRFRSGLARLRHGLPLLVGDLRETASPAALADAMLARVEQGVRARHGAVVAGGAVIDARDVAPGLAADWLAARGGLPGGGEDGKAGKGGGGGLACDRADPLFPLRVPLVADGPGLVGWLLLGPRPDGSFYGREERAALRAVADPVARALAVALARERRRAERDAREEERRRREEALAGRVAELQGAVRRLQRHAGLTAAGP